MGNISGRLIRPIKNWNIENRALKEISKNKIKRAPTFDSVQKQIDLVNKLEPDYKQKSKTKDLQLDEYLKKVYVKSNNNEIHESNTVSNTKKLSSKNSGSSSDFEFGFYEPSEVQKGKISLRQALHFIEENSKDPNTYTIDFIANKYQLDPKLVDNILKYYKIFQINVNKLKVDTASPLRLSLKSGIQVPHTENKAKVKKKKEDTMINDVKQI